MAAQLADQHAVVTTSVDHLLDSVDQQFALKKDQMSDASRRDGHNGLSAIRHFAHGAFIAASIGIRTTVSGIIFSLGIIADNTGLFRAQVVLDPMASRSKRPFAAPGSLMGNSRGVPSAAKSLLLSLKKWNQARTATASDACVSNLAYLSPPPLSDPGTRQPSGWLSAGATIITT